MDLDAVRMFVAAVQAGGLSAAATRLGIPVPFKAVIGWSAL
jgi:DNA-binding transcriptional LysR family regulator